MPCSCADHFDYAMAINNTRVARGAHAGSPVVRMVIQTELVNAHPRANPPARYLAKHCPECGEAYPADPAPAFDAAHPYGVEHPVESGQ